MKTDITQSPDRLVMSEIFVRRTQDMAVDPILQEQWNGSNSGSC